MRIVLTFISNELIRLPYSYNEIIQAFIYRHLSPDLARFLHDDGFIDGKRKFKLFTFSRLLGNIKLLKSNFHIIGSFKLIISSPYREILQSLAERILKEADVRLGDNKTTLQSIEVKFSPSFDKEAKIVMLSPVSIYSTLMSPNGKKKTYYYNPKEEEFSVLIKENILKKYRAFYGNEPDDKEFNIEPVNVSKKDEKIITYKGFVIKGWMGRYKLTGSSELLKLAYEAGIGSKNSQGFGCFEVIQ